MSSELVNVYLPGEKTSFFNGIEETIIEDYYETYIIECKYVHTALLIVFMYFDEPLQQYIGEGNEMIIYKEDYEDRVITSIPLIFLIDEFKNLTKDQKHNRVKQALLTLNNK